MTTAPLPSPAEIPPTNEPGQKTAASGPSTNEAPVPSAASPAGAAAIPSGRDLSPIRFARELWTPAPPDHFIEFVFLRKAKGGEPAKKGKSHNDESGGHKCWTVREFIEHYPTIENFLQAENHRGWNVYHSVNPRRLARQKGHGRNEDVDGYVALWADLDWHQGDEAGVRARLIALRADLERLGIPPSVIVESGYGIHLYWLLAALALAQPEPGQKASQARRCCAGIQDYCKISDAVNDPRRILRWPGTANHRIYGKHPLCRVVEASWRRYPLEAFAEVAIDPGRTREEEEEEHAAANESKRLQKTLENLSAVPPSKDPRIEEVKTQGVDESAGPYGGRHNAAKALAGHYASRLRTKKAVLQAMREWNAALCRPPIDDDQVTGMVEYAWTNEQIKRADQEPEDSGPARGRPPKAEGAAWFDENGKFNPKAMAEHLVRERRYIATPIGKDGRGIDLYLYRDGAFRAEEGADFARTETNRLLGSSSRASRINETVELLTENSKMHFRRVNPRARDFVNVKNGMLDWRTGKLESHDPDYLSTIQIPVEYDAKATSPVLDKFFEDVFPQDAVPLVEEFVGYLLVPDTRYQKAFIAVGSGANGKSTVLKLLERFLGKDNVSSLTFHEIEEDRFALVNLVGRLANICHDLDPRVIGTTGKFKRIVTGDPVTTEDKFKSSFRFTPFARLVFAANDFPRSTDKSEGYMRRLIFVPFPKVFTNETGAIPDYDKVLAETPGLLSALLNRATAGLQRLEKNGTFTMCDSVKKAIERYRRDCNSALDFVLEFCTLQAEGWISRHDLFEPYKDWCVKEGMKPMSAKSFAAAVRPIKGVFEHKNGVMGWQGLVWKEGGKPVTNADEVRGFKVSVDNRGERDDIDF